MPATTSCTPCCVETQTVNVPGIEGDPGTDGTNGTDGVNAYTTTIQDFVVPAIDASVSIFVEDASWMIPGQTIVIEGPATFTVDTVVSATQISGTFLGASGDVEAGDTISTGSGVSPSGVPVSITDQSVYASGTAATLGTSSALLDFGTTDPSLTLTGTGKWLLFVTVVLEYAAWNSNAAKAVTLKVRRTNNTAADVTNCTTTVTVPLNAGAITGTAYVVTLPVVEYTSSGSGDILQVWGTAAAPVSSGTITASACSLVAAKIQ